MAANDLCVYALDRVFSSLVIMIMKKRANRLKIPIVGGGRGEVRPCGKNSRIFVLKAMKIIIICLLQDYDAYTELEIHAELVYAECLLLKVRSNLSSYHHRCNYKKKQAMLTVCEDETLTSFLKAGLKVRQCYISFKVTFI